MSYYKTIQKNKALAAKPKVIHQGGIDLLVVSPEPGNPEPLYQVLRKEQVSGDSAKVYLKFMKDTKMPGADSGWAWSFDPAGKWHHIDQDGVVSHAMLCLLHASACTSLLLRTARADQPCDLLFPCSQGNSSWESGSPIPT